MRTHLKQLIRLPHPRRQILQRDIDSRDRFAAQQLGLIAPQNGECNTEEDVEAIDEENIPYSEQCLPPKAAYVSQKVERKNDENEPTSTGRQSVNSDKNHEKQIAARSTPSSVRCACSLGVYSCT